MVRNRRGVAEMLEVPTGGIPFAGLGFDLAPAVMAAAKLSLRKKTARSERSVAGPVLEVPTLAGYELLIRLGRETRGR